MFQASTSARDVAVSMAFSLSRQACCIALEAHMFISLRCVPGIVGYAYLTGQLRSARWGRVGQDIKVTRCSAAALLLLTRKSDGAKRSGVQTARNPRNRIQASTSPCLGAPRLHGSRDVLAAVSLPNHAQHKTQYFENNHMV